MRADYSFLFSGDRFFSFREIDGGIAQFEVQGVHAR